ncbi:MAG TPA: glycoside hydrolase family 2 TIM barrel-domain containing protein, partial [Solirubrobacteraceae bacterium]|nr:glycoside hydrolase family 2 TIM barrel-domain containing protein [Solirubrobacteraceae bacterium]
MSGGADGDRGGGPRFSRRSLLRAGVLGAAALTGGAARRPAPARAAEAGSATSALGVYQFNQDWLFGGLYAGGAEAPGHPDSGFSAVTLPHTVIPLSWGDWDVSTWQQVWIYRKHLTGPANPGTRVFVDFQGVMTGATVFLGGTQIAEHQGGYLPFSVELTQHLVAGDNVLAVVVDGRWLDVPPDGALAGASAVDYLQPAGIYRDVALRIVPAIHISDVFAKPTNVLSGPGADVQLTIDAAAAATGPVAISAAVLDGGRVIGSASGTVSVTSAGTTTMTLSVGRLNGVTLWSPDTPKLYQVAATLVANGVTHSFDVNIGFREATFATDGFHLNGQRLQIFGLNRHQLFPYTGMAASARLQRRDAEILRAELNCNMVRCSHYPQSPDFLDACDELGLMVWEEPPGWQYIGDAAFQNIVLQNVRDMVIRDRNRPSVIIWATRLNETGNNTALYTQTRALADSLDGTRQTSGAMSLYSTSNWAQDVFAYDDYHSTDSNTNATLLAPVSGVPYLVSEAVGALDGAPLYRWVDTEATLALQAKMHAQVHNLANANSAYSGLLGWAGIDYASLNGGGRIWHNLKWAGVLDTFRVPKPGAAFYRSQVDPTAEPVILPVFFWDFGAGSPPAGPGAGSMIATNCDRLELYADGTHLVTGTPDRTDYASLAHPPVIVDLTFTTPTPAELRIDGYVGADLVASVEMTADRSRDRVALVVEDATIVGDGNDMTRFTFRALDAFDNQRPYTTGDVALTLAGPATLIAQNPFGFAAYGGVGGGFIRSVAGTSGTVTVTATHPTLGTASGTLTVTPQPPPAPAGPPTAVTATVRPAPRPTTKPKARPAGPSRARVRSALAGL